MEVVDGWVGLMKCVLFAFAILFLTCGVSALDFQETKKLADGGDKTAQYNLGWIYANGRGVTQDYKEAVTWYRKAAQQGEAMAQANLGVMYMNGTGVTQDYKEAFKWLKCQLSRGNL